MKVITSAGAGEITEKKSRFIADVFPADSEARAQELIASVRKRHYDARHHCFAYACGAARELVRMSDDGEPSGTAGKPILEVIVGEDLTDTLIVVTRYFGGTLLGTGGLVRAYTKAAQAGVAAAPKALQVFGSRVTITVDYPRWGSLQHYITHNNIITDDIIYEEKVSAVMHLITDDIDKVVSDAVKLTDGRALIDIDPPASFLRSIGAE